MGEGRRLQTFFAKLANNCSKRADQRQRYFREVVEDPWIGAGNGAEK